MARLNPPTPRSLIIGDANQRGEVTLRRAWTDYLIRDLVARLGADGMPIPELEAKLVELVAADVVLTASVQAAAVQADQALAKAVEALRKAMAIRVPDIRQGAGVTVTIDAQGYTISAAGGAADFSSENHITANRVFGI